MTPTTYAPTCDRVATYRTLSGRTRTYPVRVDTDPPRLMHVAGDTFHLVRIDTLNA